MLQSIANVFRVPELRKKILITLALLVVYRIGAWLPLPGFDVHAVEQELKKMETTAAGQALAL